MIKIRSLRKITEATEDTTHKITSDLTLILHKGRAQAGPGGFLNTCNF